MSKKINVSKNLMRRLNASAANGSVIARDILKEFAKNDREVLTSRTADYFDTKLGIVRGDHNKISIFITYCNKDLKNPNFPDRNDPDAPRRKSNRTTIKPAGLIEMFNALNAVGLYDNKEIEFFAQSLCVDKKISIKLEKGLAAIEHAYNGSNYYPYESSDVSTLHSSCMRGEDRSSDCADYYSNVAGAKILVATIDNCVIGRALVWPTVYLSVPKKSDWKNLSKIEHYTVTSVLDRVYSAFPFIVNMMYAEAEKLGIEYRKTKGTYTSSMEITALKDIYGPNGDLLVHKEKPAVAYDTSCNPTELIQMVVPLSCKNASRYKKGVPYSDTFYFVNVVSDGNGTRLILTNFRTDGTIAELRSTTGSTGVQSDICPICGNVISSYDSGICAECAQKYKTNTIFGPMFLGGTVAIDGVLYPKVLAKKRKQFKTKSKIFTLIGKLGK